MRKWIEIIACAAAVCCLAACQFAEETFEPGLASLIATTEGDGPETRTSLAPAGTGMSQVLWSENDQLDVFMDGSNTPVLFTLVEGAGTKRASFHGKGEAGSYVAFYPHSMTPSLGSGGTVRFTLPATQEYAGDSFASGSFPMTAVSSSNDLRFRNVCSVLRISMKGHNVVTRIVFRSNDPAAKVRGRATVSLSDPDNPVLQLSSDSCDSLALSVPDVKLSESEDTHFFLVLPPQTYKGGFSVRVYSGERYMDKVITSDFTMKRSRVHKADPFVFTPNGFDNSEYLEGSGTAEDPFLIDSIGDLILMRDAVNSDAGIIKTSDGNGVAASNAFYRMTSDIDLSMVCSKKSGRSWAPIGDFSVKETWSFEGVFDGGGHTVSGLYIGNGKDYQGLFGFIKNGKIMNLTVDGTLTVNDSSGILAGYIQMGRSLLYNCHTNGSLQGRYNIGGVVGQGNDGIISYCSNEAAITSNGHYTGGIVGFSEFCVVSNCSNSGTIKSQRSYLGGITGYMNGARLFNCQNAADVSSSGGSYIGGICGRIWQGAKIINSSNSGSISSSGDYVGGICGHVSSEAIYYNGAGLVANCYNAGKVSGTGKYLGAIAGYSGLRDIDQASDDSPADGAWVKDSYWISDGQAGMDTAVGGGTGISENNHPLTEKQMKGTAAYNGVLYTMADGSSYSKLVDALNAGASEWGKKAMALPTSFGGFNPAIELNGWGYASPSPYPSLTDLKAVKPGSGLTEFSLSASEFAFNALAYEFEIDVTSSLSYSLGTLPSWIKEINTVSYDNRPHLKTHRFSVAINPGTESRSAVLTFTNKANATLEVKVSQEGIYLEMKTAELAFDCEEGTKRLNFSSSTRWTIASDAEWCTVTPLSGAGDAVVSVLAAANGSDFARSATITVSTADGSVSRTVAVVQSGHTSGGGGDWTKDPFVHKSLVMRLTGTWCGWCPRMNKSVKRAMELYPGKISYMALHSGGGDLDFSNAGPLITQFNLHSYPTGIIDGRILVSNEAIDVVAGKIVGAVKETEKKYGTLTGVDINSSVSGRSAHVDVNVYARKAGDYKITVFLLEDGIINRQADYEEGDHSDYVHDNVIRVAMSNVLGDPFTVTADNTVSSFSFNAGIPSNCVLANMRVLVYVQRAFGSYPVIQSGSFGNYFVDNSADVALGEKLKLALEGSSGGGGGGGGNNEGIEPGDDIDM